MEILELIALLIQMRKRLTLARCLVFLIISGTLSAVVYFRLPDDEFRPPLFMGAFFAGFIPAFCVKFEDLGNGNQP